MGQSGLRARAGGWFFKRLGGDSKLAMIAGASVASLVLYGAGAIFNHGFYYYYLIWNLFLAWLPLIFIYFLLKVLHRQVWSSWPALLLSFLWLLFLPNSFYMVSDFVHLYDVPNANVMYNVAMIASFASSGLALGYTSLRLVHDQLSARRHGRNLVWGIVTLVLILSSYAVYLGRIIRLNSWDFFTNFGAVLFTISDQFMHPSGWPAIVGITVSFFMFLMTVYLVLWQLKPRLV